MSRIDICIPVFNEAPIIREALSVVVREMAGNGEKDWGVIVVDNGSTDGTAAMVRQFGHPRVRLITLPVPGKGAAVVEGARSSNAELFGYMDVDLSVHPSHIHSLIAHIKTPRHIVAGSRLANRQTVRRSAFRTLSSVAFNAVSNLLVKVPVKDSQCGFKIMGREAKTALLRCGETGWFFDREFLSRAHRLGYPIIEVAVVWEETVFPHRRSKLKPLRAGLESVAALMRIRRRINREFSDNRHRAA